MASPFRSVQVIVSGAWFWPFADVERFVIMCEQDLDTAILAKFEHIGASFLLEHAVI